MSSACQRTSLSRATHILEQGKKLLTPLLEGWVREAKLFISFKENGSWYIFQHHVSHSEQWVLQLWVQYIFMISSYSYYDLDKCYNRSLTSCFHLCMLNLCLSQGETTTLWKRYNSSNSTYIFLSCTYTLPLIIIVN